MGASQYAFGPGFIHFEGVDPLGPLEGREVGEPNTNPHVLTTVTADATRGATRITVRSTATVSVGSWVVLAMDGSMEQVQVGQGQGEAQLPGRGCMGGGGGGHSITAVCCSC